MNRKSEFDKLVDDLINSAWWLSLIVAGAAYVFIGIIVPRQLSGTKPFSGLASIADSAAIVVALFFCFVGFLAFLNGRRKARLLDKQRDIISLRLLSWKEFEEIVAEAYRRKGYRVFENTQKGPDGGVDIRLKRDGEAILVQCKHWQSQKVGVKIVRELYGVMAAEKATHGIIISSGVFTGEARLFAQGKNLELIDGIKLLEMVREVKNTPAEQNNPPKPASESTSKKICPTCGQAMVLRIARKGPNPGKSFWGCSTFPKCKTTFPIDS